MLESRELYVEYFPGNPVLKGFDLRLDSGEKVVLMGPNGAGKSTFIKTALGMIPYRGSLRIMDGEVSSMGQEEIVGRASFLLQVDIIEDMKVSTYLRLAGISMEGKEDFMNIVPLMGRSMKSLSTGEVQRVRLSRVFWSMKPVLLMDEPFAHLDPFYQIQLVKAIKGYPGTILLTVHDVLLALRFFDSHVLMKNGRIVSTRLTSESFEETFGVSLQTFV